MYPQKYPKKYFHQVIKSFVRLKWSIKLGFAFLLIATFLLVYFIYFSLNHGGQSRLKNGEKIVAVQTISPNNPINQGKTTYSLINEDSAYIKTAIVAEKFVPKILYYRASIPYWDQERAFASLQKNVTSFNFVAVFWYTLGVDGAINKYSNAIEDKNIVAFAQENKVKVFGLVANLPDDENSSWDSKRVRLVISSKSARTAHINSILNLVKRMGFDGISIDYEELETYQKKDFTAFITGLENALHSRGKMLGVAIHPKSGEGKPQEDNGSAAQDLVPLSLAADQLYFMTYGEHWNESDAGPIASLPWVKNVINYAFTIGVPRKKIFMGIPLYGLDWPKNGSSYGIADGLTFSQVNSLISTYKPSVIVDTTEGSAHFTYKNGNQIHEVWFENYQTVQPKLKFAKSLGISATFWRLGGEDNRIWPTLNNYR